MHQRITFYHALSFSNTLSWTFKKHRIFFYITKIKLSQSGNITLKTIIILWYSPYSNSSISPTEFLIYFTSLSTLGTTLSIQLLFPLSLLIKAKVCLWWWLWFCPWVLFDSWDPTDCRPLGSSVHGISQDKNTGGDCQFLLQGDIPNPGIELESPALQAESSPELWGKCC